MKLVKVQRSDSVLRPLFDALYVQAFPVSEQKPVEAIYAQQEAGFSDVLAIIEDAGTFIGLLIIVKRPTLVLVEYLAIDQAFRGRGYGSKVLQLLLDKYHDRDVCLEIEDTSVPAENADQRQRRLRFYQDNGFQQLHIIVNFYGVRLELMGSRSGIDFEEYMQLYKQIHGEQITEKIYLAD